MAPQMAFFFFPVLMLPLLVAAFVGYFVQGLMAYKPTLFIHCVLTGLGYSTICFALITPWLLIFSLLLNPIVITFAMIIRSKFLEGKRSTTD